MTVTAERLRELLFYDPDAGTFTWRVARGGRATVGSLAGAISKRGYKSIFIDYKQFRSHRLAWLYVYGKWPDGEIDHINGNPSDNRIRNLRVSDRTNQCRNAKTKSTNLIGLKGVTAAGDRFRARIRVNYRLINIGRFNTAEEAHAAYVREAKRLFGEFARAG